MVLLDYILLALDGLVSMDGAPQTAQVLQVVRMIRAAAVSSLEMPRLEASAGC